MAAARETLATRARCHRGHDLTAPGRRRQWKKGGKLVWHCSECKREDHERWRDRQRRREQSVQARAPRECTDAAAMVLRLLDLHRKLEQQMTPWDRDAVQAEIDEVQAARRCAEKQQRERGRHD